MSKRKRYLILDANYLCHLQKHAMPEFQFGGEATGIIYGFLRYLSVLQRDLDSHRLVFCWDSKTSKRRDMFPDYKRKRRAKEYTPEEEEFEIAFRQQMKLLRIRYLKKIGFKNVFVQPGYESDDIMASICKDISNDPKKEAIIVTSDQDLLQCIRANVSFYNPTKRKLMRLKDFEHKYHIRPHEWGLLKSITGCSTDEVPGVKGVGEGYALKYLQGTLNVSTKAYEKIHSAEGVALAHRNADLVYLPMKGTKRFALNIRKDELSEKGWKQVCKQLGMKSIKDRMPFRS